MSLNCSNFSCVQKIYYWADVHWRLKHTKIEQMVLKVHHWVALRIRFTIWLGSDRVWRCWPDYASHKWRIQFMNHRLSSLSFLSGTMVYIRRRQNNEQRNKNWRGWRFWRRPQQMLREMLWRCSFDQCRHFLYFQMCLLSSHWWVSYLPSLLLWWVNKYFNLF